MNDALIRGDLGTGESPRLVWGAACALLAHGLVFALGATLDAPAYAPVLTVTEVSLGAPSEPVPVSPPPDDAPAPAAAVAAVRAPRAVRVARAAPSAPAPAAAGALLTAPNDIPSPSEPVVFAVDPQGAQYGFGVVLRGGSVAAQAGANGTAAPVPETPHAASAFRTDFAEPPRLALADPCRGHFPSAADVDQGDVLLSLEVASSGAVQRAVVVRETPTGQGFGRAALACLHDKRFSPARDDAGHAIPARAPVALRFRR